MTHALIAVLAFGLGALAFNRPRPARSVLIPIDDAELISVSLKWDRVRYRRLIDNSIFTDAHMSQLDGVRGRVDEVIREWYAYRGQTP